MARACSARSSRRSPRVAERRMSERAAEEPKIATVWLLLGTLVFLGFQWYEREQRRSHFSVAGGVIEIRRAADGHYHWPGTINGRPVEFLIDTGASGTAIPAALATRLGLVSDGQVQSSTAGGDVTGQVVARRPRASRRGARRAAAHGRAARRWSIPCSAWTCSGACAGSSTTACCASTWARRPGRVKLLRMSPASPPRRLVPAPGCPRRRLRGAAAAGRRPRRRADARRACPPPPQQLTSENMSAGIKPPGPRLPLAGDQGRAQLLSLRHDPRRQPEWMFPGPVTLDALRASDTLALELDVLDPDVQRRLAPASALAPDPLPPALVRADRARS